MTSSTERPASIRHRGAAVAIAMAVMNVATYVFTVVAARLLGPKDYGALASLMAVLLVVVRASSSASRPPPPGGSPPTPITWGRSSGRCCRLTYRGAVAGRRGLLLLTPRRSTGCCGSTAWPRRRWSRSARSRSPISGGQLGHPAGRAPLVAGVGDLPAPAASPGWSIGTALILWRPDGARPPWSGVLVGSVVPVVLGVYALRRNRDAGPGQRAPLAAARSSREILGNSQTLLAFLVLIELRRHRRPQRPRRARRRPVRRRA